MFDSNSIPVASLYLFTRCPNTQKLRANHSYVWSDEKLKPSQIYCANYNMKDGSTRNLPDRHHSHSQNDELSNEKIGLDEIQTPQPDRNIDHGPRLEVEGRPSTKEGTEKTSLSREESGLDELFAPPPDENPSEGEAYRHEDLEHQSKRKLKQQQSENTDEDK